MTWDPLPGPEGLLSPLQVHAYNQGKPFIYRCDAPTWTTGGGAGTVVVQSADGYNTFGISSWSADGPACARAADYAWRVRSRTSGRVWIIGRCRGPDADTIKAYLRSPDPTYDVVDYLLPVEYEGQVWRCPCGPTTDVSGVAATMTCSIHGPMGRDDGGPR
jgi:hypothetical protein